MIPFISSSKAGKVKVMYRNRSMVVWHGGGRIAAEYRSSFLVIEISYLLIV